MSLLEQQAQDFVILTKTSAPDEQFGRETTWTAGAAFSGTLGYIKASEMTTAQQEQNARLYGLYVGKEINLQYHQVIRRVADNEVFRVTNPGYERCTPPSSPLNKRLIEVEKWELPHDEDET